MRRIRTSIYLQSLMIIGALLTIFVALASATIAGMLLVERQTTVLEKQWIGEATLLGDIDYSVSAFRLAEVYRGIASDRDERSEAEAMAAAQRQDIDDLLHQVSLSLDRQAPAGLAEFAENWSRYKAAHDDWVGADGDGAIPQPAHFGSALAQQYIRTDAAIDALIDAHHLKGQRRADVVGRIVNLTIGVITSMALVAVLAAVWLTISMRRRLFLPLRSITHVMRSLAAGRQETRLPAMNRPDEIGDMARACEVFRVNLVQLEMAHQALQRAEEQAQKLARHDALTGLPNRRVFTANLESTIAFSLPNGRPYSVLLIDLDGFKKVNDLLGHNIGDMVLCEVAQRLRSNIRTQDTVARLGGDEFAVIASDETDLNDHMERMKLLAARLISVIGQDFICEGNVIEMGASIGISHRREGVTDVSNVLHAADVAMYRAKQSGRGAFRFFEQAMDDELRSQEMLERDLMHAIAAEAILPYYQPLVDIQTNRIRGFEALARWEHPIRGFIPPDIFIPFTERLNLMPKLTELVLRQACRDAKNWPGNTCVAVNFPPSAFQDPALPQWILNIISSEGLPPARLEIEITETALLGDAEGIRDILARLKGFGIAISLDDFGTGYSSLNHLRAFKFDKVKIDRSFVQALSGNGDNEKIIDAILGLTKSLGLPAVAEGIENVLVLAQLRSKGCEFGQGFYFAEAVPAAAALELLRLDPDDVKSNRFARRLNV